MMRPIEVTSSGTVPVQTRQVCSTSALRWRGKNSTPAYNSRTGYSRISSAVTTPTLPPPPRIAQNRSGSWLASARTRSPYGVTSSAAVTLLAASP